MTSSDELAPGTRRRAIVIGASIAGLVAARVLSDSVDEILVVDRDTITDETEDRTGVPQGFHVHVLLRRGYVELVRLFPGIDERLEAKGAVAIDSLREAVWISRFGQAPRFTSRLRSRVASRSLIESTVRELTLARPNIRLLDRHEVIALLGDRTSVRGVRIRQRAARGEAQSSDESSTVDLPAWLVVDASGRSSRAPELLEVLGAPVPEETVIDASLTYSTRLYRTPPGTRDWKVMLVRDRPPSGTKGGVILQVEGDRWLVTLGGAGRDQPPTDEAGFDDFARSLVSDRLHEAIRDAEPLTPVRGWARTANRWRHVERIDRWPAGFALVGDAMCALNPVYGQGMSVAAMEGGVIATWLASSDVQRARRAGRPPATRRLVRALAATARLPWFLATSEDARIEGVQGAPKPGRFGALATWYVDQVLANAASDPTSCRRFSEVSQLVRPPLALLDPAVVWRVLAGRGTAARRHHHRGGAAGDA